MKIAILSTRGIPNYHGGFEQFAEYFAVFMANKNHEVYVYNSHDHPYQKATYKGVHIIHCFDPEFRIGATGQFIYDYNCLVDCRKRDFDVILQLGYTSISIWHVLLPKKPIIVTNMDGLEWKRTKYSQPVKKFLKYAEKLAVKSSDYLIADSVGIQQYIKESYDVPSTFIAYGATVFEQADSSILKDYGVLEYQYCIAIARLEPENNIETIVEGYHSSSIQIPLLIFGTLNKFGISIKEKYLDDKRIRFVGSNYNQNELNNLRYFSRYYFHGHSVGGTNPSLLEAMASRALIVAHDNIFNRSILENEAMYFRFSNDLTALLDKDQFFERFTELTNLNIEKIKTNYSLECIHEQYEGYLLQLISKDKT